MPKAVKFLQILLKVYTKRQISLRADLATTMQEKNQYSRLVIWRKECLSGVASCCIEAFLNRSFFVSE